MIRNYLFCSVEQLLVIILWLLNILNDYLMIISQSLFYYLRICFIICILFTEYFFQYFWVFPYVLQLSFVILVFIS